jgi:hypothetical protein
MQKNIGPCLELIFNSASSSKRIVSLEGLEPKVAEARSITARFFSSHHNKERYIDPLQWAFYDRFFLDVALPYTRYQDLLNQCQNAKQIEYSNIPPELERLLSAFCFHFKIPLVEKSPAKRLLSKLFFAHCWRLLLAAYSVLNLMLLLIFPSSKRTAVWTGDFLSKTGNLDPRLADLEIKMLSAGQIPVPFIRTVGIPIRSSMKNFFKRRGFSVYYECINEVISWLTSDPPRRSPQSNLFDSAFVYLYATDAHKLKFQIIFWKKMFQVLRFQSLVAWFLSSRTACLIWAAREANLTSIGFMHGMSVMTFMGHEFMPEYSGPPIGTDYFGTWSTWWLDYFRKNSQIYPKQKIEISGPLKKMKLPIQSVKKTTSKKINLYFISEHHLPLNQLLPYLNEVIDSLDYQITFKVRPFGKDFFWDSLIKSIGIDLRQIQKSEAPTPECFKDADIVVGTHSTAIFEALAIGKPILLMNTPKWGDYFDLKDHLAWVNSPKDFKCKLEEVLKADNKKVWTDLYRRFFDTCSGTDWIVSKIALSQPRKVEKSDAP